MSSIYPPLISPRIVRVQQIRAKKAERYSAQVLNLPRSSRLCDQTAAQAVAAHWCVCRVVLQRFTREPRIHGLMCSDHRIGSRMGNGAARFFFPWRTACAIPRAAKSAVLAVLHCVSVPAECRLRSSAALWPHKAAKRAARNRKRRIDT